MTSPNNSTPGIYYVRLQTGSLHVEAPSLADAVTALGGRVRNGGPVVWGGKVLRNADEIEPDLVVIPIPGWA